MWSIHRVSLFRGQFWCLCKIKWTLLSHYCDCSFTLFTSGLISFYHLVALSVSWMVEHCRRNWIFIQPYKTSSFSSLPQWLMKNILRSLFSTQQAPSASAACSSEAKRSTWSARPDYTFRGMGYLKSQINIVKLFLCLVVIFGEFF